VTQVRRCPFRGALRGRRCFNYGLLSDVKSRGGGNVRTDSTLRMDRDFFNNTHIFIFWLRSHDIFKLLKNRFFSEEKFSFIN